MQIKGHGAKLPRKQGDAILALLSCKTMDDAAKKIEVAPSTLFRWLQDNAFRQQYQKAKSQCVSQAIARLQQASLEAVEVLQTVMADITTPPSVRVTASKTIIDSAIKGVELEEIVLRTEKLEKLLEEKEK